MANENTQAVEILSKWIISTCQKLINKAKFDKTYEAVVSVVNKDSYIVEYAGTQITIKTPTGTYKIGDRVRICIPQGNRRKAYLIDPEFII